MSQLPNNFWATSATTSPASGHIHTVSTDPCRGPMYEVRSLDGRHFQGSFSEVPVHFLGFNSTVGSLHNCGWQIDVENYQDMNRMMRGMKFVFSNARMKCVGMSEIYDGMNSHTSYNNPNDISPIFVKHLSTDIQIQHHQQLNYSLKTVAEHEMHTMSLMDILTSNNEPLTEDQNPVMFDLADFDTVDLLKAVKEKQRPRQKELRAKAETNHYKKESFKLIGIG